MCQRQEVFWAGFLLVLYVSCYENLSVLNVNLNIYTGCFLLVRPKNEVPDPQEILSLFRWDLLCDLTLRDFRGGPVKKTTLYDKTWVCPPLCIMPKVCH